VFACSAQIQVGSSSTALSFFSVLECKFLASHRAVILGSLSCAEGPLNFVAVGEKPSMSVIE